MMTRKITIAEKRIIRKLKEINDIWVDSLKLFADNESLVLIDTQTGEILFDLLNNILCDGGDPDHTCINGVEYINKTESD